MSTSTRVARTVALTVAVGALLLPASSTTLQAQSLAAQTSGEGPANVISVNPFMLLWGWVSGEYERRMSPTLALAVGGSYFDIDDNRYASADVRARLYPNERALAGFGLSGSVGVASLTDDLYSYDRCMPEWFPNCETNTRKTYTAPTFGLELTYQWMLGTRKSTTISVGAGTKRAIGGRNTFGDNTRFLPVGKLNVGYAW